MQLEKLVLQMYHHIQLQKCRQIFPNYLTIQLWIQENHLITNQTKVKIPQWGYVLAYIHLFS